MQLMNNSVLLSACWCVLTHLKNQKEQFDTNNVKSRRVAVKVLKLNVLPL